MKNLKIDKKNGHCLYNDEQHVYWNEKDNLKYISVTTLIHKFQQAFDEDFWSAYKAFERIMGDDFKHIKSELLKTKKFDPKLIIDLKINPVEFDLIRAEILQEWENTRNASCIRGTGIHLEKELKFYENKEHEIKHFGLGGKFTCEPSYYELDLEKGVYPEYLVSYIEDNFRIAGQVDLLIKDGNDIYIIDYKTNKKLDKTSYYNPKAKKHEMMKYPLSNIMDCNMMHYTLQLSMYAYLLQKVNPEFNIKKLMIIHYDHDGNENHYELEYLKSEIESLIKFYKKDTALKERKANRKQIEY